MLITVVYDSHYDVGKVVEALTNSGHEVGELELSDDPTTTLTEILLTHPEVVFLGCKASPTLTALLSEFHISYTGTSTKLIIDCANEKKIKSLLKWADITFSKSDTVITAVLVGEAPNIKVILPKLEGEFKSYHVQLEETARNAYQVIGMDGYGQIDLAIEEEKVVISAVNAEPWTQHLDEEPYWLPMLARGESIEGITDKLVKLAMNRYKW